MKRLNFGVVVSGAGALIFLYQIVATIYAWVATNGKVCSGSEQLPATSWVLVLLLMMLGFGFAVGYGWTSLNLGRSKESHVS